MAYDIFTQPKQAPLRTSNIQWRILGTLRKDKTND
jgi:hypothetical protein